MIGEKFIIKPNIKLKNIPFEINQMGYFVNLIRNSNNFKKWLIVSLVTKADVMAEELILITVNTIPKLPTPPKFHRLTLILQIYYLLLNPK